jgi:hypothetical protein
VISEVIHGWTLDSGPVKNGVCFFFADASVNEGEQVLGLGHFFPSSFDTMRLIFIESPNVSKRGEKSVFTLPLMPHFQFQHVATTGGMNPVDKLESAANIFNRSPRATLNLNRLSKPLLAVGYESERVRVLVLNVLVNDAVNLFYG